MASRTAQPMQRTSPVPLFERAEGFTLVEVLIALFLAVILVAVTASTLGTTLRSEESMNLLETGERIIQTLQTDLYLNGQATNTIQRYSAHWLIAPTQLETGEPTNRIAWHVWEITAMQRPSIQWRFAIRSTP